MITNERLSEALAYCRETGQFTWPDGRRAGCIKAGKYVVIRIDGKLHYAHRLAWQAANGTPPGGVIDHINGNGLDNRLCNLRCVSTRINSQNRRTPGRETASGLLGVQRNHGGWQALIQTEEGRISLGTYKSKEEAYSAYLTAKRVHHEGCTI